MVYLGKYDFQVVGVVEDWYLQFLFYVIIGINFDDGDQFFLFLFIFLVLYLDYNWDNGWGKDDLLISLMVSWLLFWVEFDSFVQVSVYWQFLVDYLVQQKEFGCYECLVSEVKLYGLMDWLCYEGLVLNDVMLQIWLVLGFFFVCLVNIVVLLLVKFLCKGGEISVCCVLGVWCCDVFYQLGVELVLIGLVGGVFGIGLVELGFWMVCQWFNDYVYLVWMNGVMLVDIVVLVIVVSLLVGLLLVWWVCCILLVL